MGLDAHPAPTMLADLEVKRKATVGKNKKTKKAKAVRKPKQDVKRDAALKLVDKLNQDTTHQLSDLVRVEYSVVVFPAEGHGLEEG